MIAYRGLTPGSTYLLTGSLVDKDGGAALGLEEQAEFVPESEDGSAEVVFVCDGTLVSGKDIVAFETLSHEGKDIVVHADPEDAAQTVSISALRTRLAEKHGGRKAAEPASRSSMRAENTCAQRRRSRQKHRTAPAASFSRSTHPPSPQIRN